MGDILARPCATRVSWTLLALATASGCQSTSAEAPTKTRFVEAYAALTCRRLAECYGASDHDCVESVTTKILSLPAVAAEHARYDAEEGGRCLDSLAKASCDRIAWLDLTLRPCDAVFEGQQAPGDACALGEDCKPGSSCSWSSECVGVCRAVNVSPEPEPTAGLGEPCNPDLECGPGLTCADEGDPCIEGTPRGQPCGEGLLACGNPLVCDYAEIERGICRDRADVTPTRVAGDACGRVGSTSGCVDGFFCDTTLDLPVCEPQLGEGSPCTDMWSCADGTHCSDGTCVAFLRWGDRCDQDLCTEGDCVEGTCQLRAGLGEPCTGVWSCYSFNCQNGVCVPSCPAAGSSGGQGGASGEELFEGPRGAGGAGGMPASVVPGGLCLAQAPPSDPERPGVQCTVVEALPGDRYSLSAGCVALAGRLPLDPASSADTKLDAAVRSELERSGWCGVDREVDCSDVLLCKIQELQGQPSCQNDPIVADDAVGWCYLADTEEQLIGNPALVADCPELERRMLRFVGADLPAPYAATYVKCGWEA